MLTMPRRRLGAIGLAMSLSTFVACGSANVIGPANQLQVANVADNFQFQVTGLANVTQTLTYSWTNSGDSANINLASTLSGGTATLTVRGPTGTVLYQSGLQANGTFHTQKGTTGTWQVELVLAKATGTLNFRVQKAP